MAAERRLALHAVVPERYFEHRILASTIDRRGRLVALLADPSQDLGHFPRNRGPETAPCYSATVIICDGSEIHEIRLTDLDLRFSAVDVLDDGIVLAARRCEPVGIPYERFREPVNEEDLHLTANVQVFGSDGTPRAAFYVGDAIEQLMTDAQGNIWTGYFDESNYWSPNTDGTRSYGFGIGLACWDEDGGPLWMAGGETPGVSWCDCYALNVGHELVHACPYADFPLVELDAHGVRSFTPSPVRMCSGLAVAGPDLAFFDQNRQDGDICWQIRHAHRENETIEATALEPLRLPDGRNPTSWACGLLGRDHRLWLYEADNPRHWYRYDLDPK